MGEGEPEGAPSGGGEGNQTMEDNLEIQEYKEEEETQPASIFIEVFLPYTPSYFSYLVILLCPIVRATVKLELSLTLKHTGVEGGPDLQRGLQRSQQEALREGGDKGEDCWSCRMRCSSV